jgi:aspartate/methionine/tyrosine aminotransferase
MISSQAKKIRPFIVMDVLEKAQAMERKGINVIHLEVGEPDFDTPACIKEAACKAIYDGYTHYTPSMGLIELKEAISEHYAKTYQVNVNPDQILIFSGTSPAMLAVFSVLLEKNDQVIISDPHYPCYPNFINFVHAEPVTIPVYEDNGFQYEPESIQEKITKKTKAIIINSPSNPTGHHLDEHRIKAIAVLTSPSHQPCILSDEIYHGLMYQGTAHSILEFTDHAFVFNGFSKLYAMTGFRLGYVIAPKTFVRPIQKIQQNFFICAGAMAQVAGIAALKHAAGDIKHMKTIYNQRRLYMIQRLKTMGFKITVEPTGAFYVFVNAKHISNNSYKLAFDILDKARVGVTPGIDFGENGEGFLRFSYANSMENITEGMNRIEHYLKSAPVNETRF